MKTHPYIKSIFPSMAVTASLFILPIVLTLYFVVTQYSDKFIAEQDISYFDVQNNWLGQLFIDQKWVEWFNRFMDFAFWGILAAVVLVGVWMFTSAKVAMKNHYNEENFVNFQETKTRWHTHFFIVVVIKIAAVLILLFALFTLIGQRIPALATEISSLTHQFS